MVFLDANRVTGLFVLEVGISGRPLPDSLPMLNDVDERENPDSRPR